jgi:hypothetical protein
MSKKIIKSQPKKAPAPTVNTSGRQQRLEDWSEGRGATRSIARVNRGTYEVQVRAHKPLPLTWRPASEMLVEEKDASKIIDPKNLSIKIEKASDYIGTYKNFNGVIRPEYDVLEPFVIYDTEVFVRQAINRKLALMFRNGYEITSDLSQNSDYINKRLATMEYVLKRPVDSFFRDILSTLLLTSNCFLRKIRDAKGSPGLANEKNENKVPIAGYSIIPCHQIVPFLRKGYIEKYRRYFETGQPYEDIPASEIIHLKWDVKPGHIYGTPRTVGVRDDIYALRRLEENIELLYVNHLFPLFHVKVGTEKAPCTYLENGQSEIDAIRYQIETMPKEGVFVSDERTSIDAVGAEGKSLEAKELIAHLKGRVYTGLGMSPLDMGEGDSANRSTADNISQNLKDSIKADLDQFADMIRMYMFREWFEEANYSFSLQKAVSSTKIEFHEIDLDNKIKFENHVIQLYMNHLITETEARKMLKRVAIDPEAPIEGNLRKQLHFDLHIVRLVKETAKAKAEAEGKLAEQAHGHAIEQNEQLHKHTQAQAETQMGLLEKQGEVEATKAMAHAHKAEAQTKLTHAKTKHAIALGNMPAAHGGGKASATKSRPSNQHGTNPGPTRAKSSKSGFITLLKDKLTEARGRLVEEGFEPSIHWNNTVPEVIKLVVDEFNGQETNKDDANCYTKQYGIDNELLRLKYLIAQTDDLDLLSILLDEELEEDTDAQESGNSEMEPSTVGDQTNSEYDSDGTIGAGDQEPGTGT